MWILKVDGNAIEGDTGEEIYTDYVRGIVSVYRDAKKIAWFSSLPDARAFIKKTVDELNGGKNCD